MLKRISIIALFMVMLFSQGVFAETSMTVSGQHVVKNNELLKSVQHTFVLTAKNDAPMPEGSENGVKTITIASNEPFSFGEIKFTEPGTYEYVLSRKTDKSESLDEDNSVYHIKAAMFSDGTITTVYQKEGESAKTDKLVYEDTQYCTLTFILNGGNIDGNEGPINIREEYGKTVNLLGAPEKEGYVFDYWRGSRYDANAEYLVEGDHTFNAEYKIASYEEPPEEESEENIKKPENKDKTVRVIKKISKAVNTGDNMMIYISSAILVAAVIALIVVRRKKK